MECAILTRSIFYVAELIDANYESLQVQAVADAVQGSAAADAGGLGGQDVLLLVVSLSFLLDSLSLGLRLTAQAGKFRFVSKVDTS